MSLAWDIGESRHGFQVEFLAVTDTMEEEGGGMRRVGRGLGIGRLDQ
jgi:hypothetical protein